MTRGGLLEESLAQLSPEGQKQGPRREEFQAGGVRVEKALRGCKWVGVLVLRAQGWGQPAVRLEKVCESQPEEGCLCAQGARGDFVEAQSDPQVMQGDVAR